MSVQAPVLTKRTGKRGRVIVGGSGNTQTGSNHILTMRKWTLTDKGNVVPISGFENGGYTSGLIGLHDCDFTFEGVWDVAVNWQDDPPGLYPRHDLQNLYLILDSVDNSSVTANYQFPWAIISQGAFTVDANNQALVYSVTGTNNGSYTVTTGSITSGGNAPNYF